jgi:hypothetical protein
VRRFRITAKYGLDYGFAAKHQQAPHFSMTGEIDIWTHLKWDEFSGGAIHEKIAEHFPELANLVQWHLTSTVEPLHYLANAEYWWEKVRGISRWGNEPGEKPLEAFKHTIVWGAIPDDNELEFLMLSTADNWKLAEEKLRLRLPVLMSEFHRTMKRLELLSEDLKPVSAT